MERWFEFMGNHPFLFTIMFVLIVAYFMVDSKSGGKKISPNTLSMMYNNENAELIDIRPKKDFEKGYIKGSRNIPFTELKDHLDTLRNSPNPIIIICQMGMTASTAVAMIAKDNVYRLDGGIGNWQASGLPLVAEKTVSSKK